MIYYFDFFVFNAKRIFNTHYYYSQFPTLDYTFGR